MVFTRRREVEDEGGSRLGTDAAAATLRDEPPTPTLHVQLLTTPGQESRNYKLLVSRIHFATV